MPSRKVRKRSAEEERLAFQAALTIGEVVYAQCFCTRWWIARCDVGMPCHSCGEKLQAIV